MPLGAKGPRPRNLQINQVHGLGALDRETQDTRELGGSTWSYRFRAPDGPDDPVPFGYIHVWRRQGSTGYLEILLDVGVDGVEAAVDEVIGVIEGLPDDGLYR